jgi:hypothetical protein
VLSLSLSLYIYISTNTLSKNSTYTYTEIDILSASRKRDFPLLMALRKGTRIAYLTTVVFVFLAVIVTVHPLAPAGLSCKQGSFPYLLNNMFSRLDFTK